MFALLTRGKLGKCHAEYADCEQRLESFAKGETLLHNLELPFNASKQAVSASYKFCVWHLLR